MTTSSHKEKTPTRSPGRGRRRGLALSFVMVALITTPVAQALTVHVAPTGGDDAMGTRKRPLLTLQAAVERLRDERGSHEIRLAAGTYSLWQPLRLGPEDSGRAGGPLRIVGAADGSTTLSGFRPLRRQGWKPLSDPDYSARVARPQLRKRIMQYRFNVEVSARLGRLSRRGFDADDRRETAPAMLHLGASRMTLARWPDAGTVPAVKVTDPGPVRYGVDDAGWEKFWTRGGALRIGSSRPATWAVPSEVWVSGRFGKAWEWSYNRVEQVRDGGRGIRLAYGEVSGIGADENHAPEFYFENVFEELDQPGEYFIDAKRGLLFFLPPERMPDWQNKARISWNQEALLVLEDIRHVRLENLRIEGGRGNGIEIIGGLDIGCRNLHLRACAGDGMVIDGREIRVEELIAEDLGGRGINLQGGDLAALKMSGSVIHKSRFVGLSWWDRAWRPAIELKGVGHQVRDCEFSDLPHMAIEASGNDFKISGCWFNRTCTGFRDMCAIYFNLGESPEQRGTIISGNLFQNIGVGSDGARGGVYLDNGTMGVTVVDNVFHRVGEGKDGWAVMNHGGAHNRVDSNAFINCPVPYHLGYWWNTRGKTQLPEARKAWASALDPKKTVRHMKVYPELETFHEEDRVFPNSNSFSDNRIFNSRRELLAEGGTSVFGGPLDKLKAENNSVGRPPGGLSFDGAGRPVIPGWRAWKAVAYARR